MMRSLFRPASVVIVLALAASLPVAAQVTLPIRMRSFAVNMSNNLTGANGIIQITLDNGPPSRSAPRFSRRCPRVRTTW